MARKTSTCPDCSRDGIDAQVDSGLDRRGFIRQASAVAVATSLWPHWASAKPADSAPEPESLVKSLYASLSETQRKEICFDWDHKDAERGLLRTRISNNWQITNPRINGAFFTKDQQEQIRALFEGIIQPDWHQRIYKQLDDDAGGYGQEQSIALFGTPESGKFEFVMTGRHMTLRCDGNSTDHVAFGGPIFYGHAPAPDGFNESPKHENNVFWHQALGANKLFQMLDGRQQNLALVKALPEESAVGFRGTGGTLPGIPLTEMSSDQKEQVQKVLEMLIEPYRQSDRDEVVACLKAQGGLDGCSLAFYQEGDLGDDKIWDCWRLEGPAFVWYFRGTPHVHVWVNVADDPGVATNS